MQLPVGPSAPPADHRGTYTTIAQLAVSGLGMVVSMFAAGLLGLMGLVSLFNSSLQSESTIGLFSIAWICLLAAVLAVPSLVFSIQRLAARPILPGFLRRPANGFLLSSILLLVWPVVLLLGYLVSGQPRLAWLLLPPIQLLTVGIPIWFLIEFARRGLPVASRQRGWGLINFSVFITTPVMMVVELLVIFLLAVLFAIWASTQPGVLESLRQLMERMSNAQANPEAMMQLLTPYLSNPWVIAGALAILAILVPMIEEMLKPLAVWLLVGRPLTPAEGFVAGAMCGGAFALIESLFYLSSPVGTGWLGLAVGRTGTELLHITTAAITGWGLASAWQNRAYLRLALAYLLAVSLHGLWNGFSILPAFESGLSRPIATPPLLRSLALAAPYSIVALAVILFVLLWFGSWRLHRTPGRNILPTQPAGEPLKPSSE